MAMALRPRRTASTISSRYGSQALACGARPGATRTPASVDTSPLVAGFGGAGSVDTSGVVAGFGGQSRGPPTPPTHRDARGFLDAPQRPTQSPQRQDLLSCVFAQDVAHPA